MIGLVSSLIVFSHGETLNDVLLYQQAQDIMEVCIKRNATRECFDFLTEENPGLAYCLNGECIGEAPGIEITRYSSEKEIRLRVWIG